MRGLSESGALRINTGLKFSTMKQTKVDITIVTNIFSKDKLNKDTILFFSIYIYQYYTIEDKIKLF